MKSRKLVTVGAIVLSFGLLLGGCGKAAEKVVENQTGTQIEDDGDGNITVKSKDGKTQVGVGAEMPEDFPSDLPVPKGKLLASQSADTGWGLQFNEVTAASFEAFVSELEAKFGKETFQSSVEGSKQVAFENDSYVVSVLWASTSGEETLVYSVTKK